MSGRKWMVVSGLIWLGIGSFLMLKGLKWITLAMLLEELPLLLKRLVQLAGSLQQGSLLLMCISLLLGFIKGRMILSKTVYRIVKRLQAETSPVPFSKVYDRKYYIVIALMIGLGFLLRFIPIPFDIRGAVDVTIGSALINGAMLYFRQALYPVTSRT